MKAGYFVVVALWLGYALGYHQGARGERLAWESTRRVDLPAHTVTTSSNAGWAMRNRIFYANPHGGVFVSSSPRLAVVNRPDPRIYRQFERPLSLRLDEDRPATGSVPEF